VNNGIIVIGGIKEEANRSIEDHIFDRMIAHNFKGSPSSDTTSYRVEETNSTEVIQIATNIQVLFATTRLSGLKGKRDMTNDVSAPRKERSRAGIRCDVIIQAVRGEGIMDRRGTSIVQVNRVKMSKTPHVRRDVGLKHFLVLAFFYGAVESLNSTERLMLVGNADMNTNVVFGAVLAKLSSGKLQINVKMQKSVPTRKVKLVNTGQVGKGTLSRLGEECERTASAKINSIEGVSVSTNSFDTGRRGGIRRSRRLCEVDV